LIAPTCAVSADRRTDSVSALSMSDYATDVVDLLDERWGSNAS
jgi:hypothetical protein